MPKKLKKPRIYTVKIKGNHMKKLVNLILWTVLAGLIGCGAESQNSQIMTDDDAIVKKTKGEYYEGYFIGVPFKASRKKALKTLGFVKTFEVEINVGKIPNDANYLGALRSASIEDEELSLIHISEPTRPY